MDTLALEPLAQASLEPLEPFRDGAGVGPITLSTEHLGDRFPGEPLIDAEVEEGLLLQRQRFTELAEDNALPLHPDPVAVRIVAAMREASPVSNRRP